MIKNELRVDIFARPEFRLHLSLDIVNSVRACCAQHYSGDCVAAGELRGFVYGWYNHYKWIEDEQREIVPVHATWNQMDILSKCLENPPKEHAALAFHLQRMIHDAIRMARSAAQAWPEASSMTEFWSKDA